MRMLTCSESESLIVSHLMEIPAFSAISLSTGLSSYPPDSAEMPLMMLNSVWSVLVLATPGSTWLALPLPPQPAREAASEAASAAAPMRLVRCFMGILLFVYDAR